MNGSRPLQLLVAAVLAAAAVWIAMHTYWDYMMVDNPPKGEAVSNRYYTFEHLAQKLAVHTRQVPTLRALPPMDGVLFVDDLRGTLLHGGIDALEAWVAGGGRVLLSRSALLSNPRLQSWTGLGMARPGSDDEDGAPRAPPRATSSDAECSPYSEHLAGRETGKSFRACMGPMRVALSSSRTPAWSLSNGYGFQMLRVNIGRGSVAVIGCECLMGNKSLLREDHARIVFDSIPLRTGDHVDILNPADAEALPALLWRHAAAAIVCGLAAIGLTIWRNLPRFGPLAGAAAAAATLARRADSRESALCVANSTPRFPAPCRVPGAHAVGMPEARILRPDGRCAARRRVGGAHGSRLRCPARSVERKPRWRRGIATCRNHVDRENAATLEFLSSQSKVREHER